MTPPKPVGDAPAPRPDRDEDANAAIGMQPRRNPGTALDVRAVTELAVDARHLGARAAAIRSEAAALAAGPAGRTAEAVHLLRAVGLLDLTTLDEHDTPDSVRLLCRDALQPVPADLRPSSDPGRRDGMRVAAVCVFDRFVPVARDALADSKVRVAAVTAGFPQPLGSPRERLAAVRATVEAGAGEVDVVVSREHALQRDWSSLHAEVRALRDACGAALLKTILAAGDLDGLDTVARAGLVCCMAGADFIKTSTGRERVNATLPIGLAMSAAILRYRELGGGAVGLKPAGGIRTPEQALDWLRLAENELGPHFLDPSRFRIGASSLLANIRTRLRALADPTTGDGHDG